MVQAVVFEVAFDGAELERRRLATGHGRAAFGQLLGCSRVRVWQWETNRYQPSGAYLARITKLLSCEPGDLYRVVD